LDRVGLASCEDDKPRIAYAVKALKTGSPLPFPTSDYMRGLYGTAWSDTVNGQLVGLTGVAVLRDGGTPAAKPDLLVFRNYAAKPDPSRSPELQERPDVNVYRGGKALLYRVFVRNAANIRCLDIVLPPAGGFSAPSSQLYYRLHGELYVADFAPKIARQ
jgi:hypothetical protein